MSAERTGLFGTAPPRLIGLMATFLLVVGGLTGLALAVAQNNYLPRPKPPKLTAAGLVAQSRTELSAVASYHMVAMNANKDRLELWQQDATTVRLVFTAPDGRGVSIVLSDGREYVSGNAAYWKKEDPKLLFVADRWFLLPQNDEIKGLSEVVNEPGAVTCLIGSPGHLKLGKDTMLDGQPVHEVTNSGGLPGSTPAKWYFAASGPPDLVQIVVTGTTQPGFAAAACASQVSDVAIKAGDEATYNFDSWGGDVRVGAPPEPITIRG